VIDRRPDGHVTGPQRLRQHSVAQVIIITEKTEPEKSKMQFKSQKNDLEFTEQHLTLCLGKGSLLLTDVTGMGSLV